MGESSRRLFTRRGCRTRSVVCIQEPESYAVLRDRSIREPRRSDIGFRQRDVCDENEIFWWPCWRWPRFCLASWSIDTLMERSEKLNAWPPKPWHVVGLEGARFYKSKGCGCIPVYKRAPVLYAEDTEVVKVQEICVEPR
ncbi:hypothetical protein O3M35_003395 [Rhynocoris fuscipes]|uniref:Uncharacterized protein n=1 Tax=Rhynocoris fuscipes TaxID=488301 RepID=A0AAW1CMT6_9HEMI